MISGFAVRRAITIFAVAASLLVATRPAFAQGAEPHLPDPISTIHLHRLLDGVVGPRDPRWAEIEAAHDLYLAECRPLRDGRIAKLLPQLASGTITDPRTIDDVQQFTARIAAADDRLFSAIGELLGDEAGATLMRVRDRRTRDRLRSTMGDSTGVRRGVGLLSDAVQAALVASAESAPDPAILAAIDPVLRTYEEKATSIMRRAADLAIGACEDGARAVREAKLPDPDRNDPEGWQRWWEVFNAGATSRRQRVGALLAELKALDGSTAAAILKDLPFQVNRLIRHGIERSAPGPDTSPRACIEMCFQLALRSPDVDAEGKKAALDMYQAWAKEDAVFVDRWLGQYPTTPEGFAAREADRSARRDMNLRWLDRLVEEKAGWIKPVRDRWMSLGSGRSDDELAPFDDEFLFQKRDERGFDIDATGRPGPLAAERVERLADRLRLDDGERAIARSLHEELATRWNEAMAPLHAAVWASEMAMQRHEGDRIQTLAERIEPYVHARLAVQDGAAKVDDVFYDDLTAALGERLSP